MKIAVRSAAELYVCVQGTSTTTGMVYRVAVSGSACTVTGPFYTAATYAASDCALNAAGSHLYATTTLAGVSRLYALTVSSAPTGAGTWSAALWSPSTSTYPGVGTKLGTLLRGVSSAPRAGGAVTPTASPSPSPTAWAAFGGTANVLVLRVGSATTSGLTAAMVNVFLDEFSVSGTTFTFVKTFDLTRRSCSYGATFGCFSLPGASFDFAAGLPHGQLSLSANKAYVAVAGYAAGTAGFAAALDRAGAQIAGLRGGLHELATSVERLRQQLREVEIQAETQMQSRQGHTPGAAGFDPLELDRFTRMQELTRSMAESVNDIATVQRPLARAVDVSQDDLSAHSRQTRDLQRDLLRTRMLEIGSIAERLRRTVRQAAQDSGKEVRLEIEGETLEVDRGMLDRMTPVFEHLLRNAVAHGIEPAFERQQAGKPACGLLRIVLEQAGNDIALRFEDDGAGLDLDRITAKARSQGLLADTPQALSPAAAAARTFFFAEGVSEPASHASRTPSGASHGPSLR
jgi:signal transduction histidine kinase